MYGLESLLVLLALAVLLLPILAVWLWVTVLDLRRRVLRLENAAGTQAVPAQTAATASRPAPTERAVGDPARAAMTETPSVVATAAPDAVASAAASAPPGAVTPPDASQPPPLPQAWRASDEAAAAEAAFADARGDDHTDAHADSVADNRHATGARVASDGGRRAHGAFAAIQRWFTVGNVPVKVGMVVLFAGIAALLKYASDQGWLRMPIEVRLLGVAVAALAGLVFGWRQRTARPSFALALQGGAIGVLLLVVFAAARRYALLDGGVAFGLSVALVALMAWLAHLQASRALAVLAVLAGFLAPIWLSSGQGDHVMLFSYYALLNLGIVVLAWRHAWRELNLLGFVFTFGIGVAWGVLRYEPALRASTEPFLLLFFAIYLLIPVLNLLRQPLPRRDAVDGTLVFATPLLAFALEAGLRPDQRSVLAGIALALALLYALLFLWLRRRAPQAVLVAAYRVLAIGFATLAVPLALSARATSAVYAVEGAALLWLGLRRGRALPQVVGLMLQGIAAGILFWALLDGSLAAHVALANPRFAGMLVLAIAALFSAWCLQREGNRYVAAAAYAWGLLLWLLASVLEISDFVPRAQGDAVLLLLLAATGWLALLARRRISGALLSATFIGTLPLAALLAADQARDHGSPFVWPGVLAWLAFAVLGLHALQGLRAVASRTGRIAHWLWWLLWPWVIALVLADGRLAASGGDWRMLVWALPWLLVLWISGWRPAWIAWPWSADAPGHGLRLLQGSLAVVLGLWWCAALLWAGSAPPLPWLPLLNPLLLMQAAVLWLLWRDWVGERRDGSGRWWLLAAGFVLLSVETLRGVHHLAGVAYGAGLFDDRIAQASLTVVWSVLGVVGWVLGSRRGQRRLWLAGAVLMGVVLAKLLLVDRHNLGNVAGIASFIAYGLLCTVVGYLAPAPPKRQALH